MIEKWLRHVEVRTPSRVFSQDDIDLEFSIEAGGKEQTAAKATVGIWNLAPASRDHFTKGLPVQVVAGYQNDSSALFTGTIDTVTPRRDGGDSLLQITALDALQAMREAQRISLTFPAGTSIQQALRATLTAAGTAVGVIGDPGVVLLQATTLAGRPAEILDDLVQMTNGALIRTYGRPYYVQNPNHLWTVTTANNIATFTRKDQPAGFAVEMSGETGLLQVTRKDDPDGLVDYEVESLLEHRVTMDSIVLLRSAAVTGSFRAVTLKHQCSDEDYTTTIEVKAI